MKTLDIKTALIIAVPTGFVTSLTMNFLEDQYSWPVAFAIGAVAGILSGLVALVVQHLSIEGCRRLGRGGFETRPVVVGRRSNHW